MVNRSTILYSITIWNLTSCLVFSTAAEDLPANSIRISSSENRDRVKSKHQEMWNIISRMRERKEILETFSLQHKPSNDRLFENNTPIFGSWGLYCFGSNCDEVDDDKKLSYAEQNLKLNIKISKMLMRELDKLLKLERECRSFY